MSYSFVARHLCPSCNAPGATSLYRCGYAEQPIRRFIESYYRIDADQLAGGVYELARCGACDLIFQRWIADEKLLAELYGVWIEKQEDPESDPQYRADIAAIPLSRDAHEVLAAAAHLGLTPDRMATLDYGMGWALWARIAKALGCRSYGNDLSPARMRYAAGLGIETLTDEEIGENRFHFINTEQVFEHVADPAGLAKRLATALVPGGILKISVPAGEQAEAVVAALKEDRLSTGMEEIVPIQPLEHVNCFRRRSIELLAASTGLVVTWPKLRHRYAFLRFPGAVALSRPRKLAKELVRPIHQFHSRGNLYRWLRKPA